MGEEKLELWGGVECTVNRVGDVFRDQLRMTGHDVRKDDLARIAELGIEAVRLPVLWERVAPQCDTRHDWRWSDALLAEARRLGLRPIVGLLHHGSGPSATSLVSDDFIDLFARYAGAAAARYSWVADWTPINEPLTTARFSTLYGTWYPHARDQRLFWLAVVNQAQATIAAMAAIRAIIPHARLIQTDDLGETFGPEQLRAKVDYYNERRWLAWDLITGRVTPGHPLWDEGAALGFGGRLRVIAGAPCPPQIIGINHYPTSDRALLPRRSASPHDGEPFEDLAAIRVLDPPPGGLASALRQAWRRYGIPIAITECHLGCTREEQLRWLRRAWDCAVAARAEGVEVRALTAWALLGNVDWVNLITTESEQYEPGVFDTRGPAPRATATARLLGAIGGAAPCLPILHDLASQPGWWERDIRLEQNPVLCEGTSHPSPLPFSRVPPILITGATGILGQAIAGACRLRGLRYVLTDRARLPIEDADAVDRILAELRPWALINAAGWGRIDDAEGAEDACFRANAEGSAVLAGACARHRVHCTLLSPDLVFGDDLQAPRDEQAPADPLNVYGRSKKAGEARALTANPAALVIRTGALFSPFDPHNFAMQVERTLRDGGRVMASADHVVSPTYLPALVGAVLDLAIDHESGVWHVTHEEPVSWLAFAGLIAAAMDLPHDRIAPATPGQLGWRATRPRNAALRSNRGRLLPTLTDAIATHAAERRRSGDLI